MKAAIDIGTNTVLLLVAEYKNDTLIVHHEDQRMTRLGEGVDESRRLHAQPIRRVINALLEYKAIVSDTFGEIEIIVTATSAVRDAANKQEFLGSVLQETGLKINILSGSDEADYTYTGAISMLSNIPDTDTLVIDIGGGSTEIIVAKGSFIRNAYSFDIGCVRFTERYLKSDPPTKQEIEQCEQEIVSLFSQKKFKIDTNKVAIGVAGTITSLAALLLGTEQFEKDAVDNYPITSVQLSDSINTFSSNSHKELLEMNPLILEGRVDVFLAGLLILKSFLNLYGLDEIKVSTGGVRHGAILKALRLPK